MKNIWMAFIVAAGAFLIGCSEDDKNDNASVDHISISAESIPAGPEGTAAEIKVSSSGDWRLAGTCDWVHPSIVAGASGESVTFTIDPNPTAEVREMKFKFFTGSAVATLNVTSGQGYSIELVSNPEERFSKNKSTLRVKLYTNISELTTTFSDDGSDWISFDKRTDAFGVTNLLFNLTENKTYDNRSSVVTIAGEGCSVEVKVVQNQVDAIAPVKTAFDVVAAGENVSVEFDTNFDYVIEIPERYAPWIHRVTNQSAPKGLTKRVETFRIDPTKALRSGNLKIRNADNSVSATITFNQVGAEHFYTTIPDANFSKWLIDNGYAVQPTGSEFEITQEGLDAKSFDITSKQIKSLEGIQVFASLTTLTCSRNPLPEIILGDMKVSTVMMTGSSAANVVISGVNLTSLDVNGSSTILKTLDVTGCPALETLNISNCYYFNTLYLRTGQTIANINDSKAGNYVSGGYKKVYK